MSPIPLFECLTLNNGLLAFSSDHNHGGCINDFVDYVYIPEGFVHCFSTCNARKSCFLDSIALFRISWQACMRTLVIVCYIGEHKKFYCTFHSACIHQQWSNK